MSATTSTTTMLSAPRGGRRAVDAIFRGLVYLSAILAIVGTPEMPTPAGETSLMLSLKVARSGATVAARPIPTHDANASTRNPRLWRLKLRKCYATLRFGGCFHRKAPTVFPVNTMKAPNPNLLATS